MCQPKDKGGRRCPVHQPASIGMRNFIKAQYGLMPGQIMHTFNGLRQVAKDRPNPSVDEYQHFINRQKTILGNSNISDKEKRRVERQLNKELSESELPDGATFYALKKLLPRSREQKREFVQVIRNIADHKGVSRNVALREFREKYEANEDKFKEDSYESSFDKKTEYIKNAMLDKKSVDDQDQVPVISPTPRIERDSWRHRSTWIRSAGYDPEDGRMEIETDSGVYAYHSVPQNVWNDIEALPSAPSYISRNIMRNPRYAYESHEESVADGYGRWCRDCHKYRAATGHICEGPSDEQVQKEEEEKQARLHNKADDETVTNETPKKTLSYEESLARLKEKLNEDEQAAVDSTEGSSTSTPRRRRSNRPTARQRRWAVPVADRETTTIDGNEVGKADLRTGRALSASRYRNGYQVPKVAAIRRAVMMEGKVAEFDVTRRISEYDQVHGFTVATVTMPYRAYAEGNQGDVKIESRTAPQCDCDTYRRNGNCSHLNSAFGQDMDRLEAVNESVAGQVHGHISPESRLRQENGGEGSVDITSRSPNVRMRPMYGYRVNGGVARGVTLNVATANSLRRMVDNGDTLNVNIGSNYHDFHFSDGDSRHTINDPIVTVSKNSDGEYEYSLEHASACRCGQPGCEGEQALKEYFSQNFENRMDTGRGRSRRRNSTSAEQEFANLSSSERLRKLDELDSSSWDKADPDSAKAFQDIHEQPIPGVDRRYNSNLESYLEDYRAAEKRAKDEGSALAYTRENATNGICSRESGRGFGVELEFDLPSGPDRREKMDAIGRDLYEAGLTRTPYQQHYHANAASSDPYTSWTLESDCTVDGEIVSPILHDTPEDWEQIEKVCDIVKRHGGKASTRTGGHVHMSLGEGDRAEVERRKVAATQIYGAYQDTLRRIQANPKSKKHRDSQWAPPMNDGTAQRNVYSIRGGRRMFADHNSSLNLGHEGRIEFRGADGSLDPAHIQAQVVTSAAIVNAAERGEVESDRPYVSKIGHNAQKTALIRSKKSKNAPKSDDELVVSDKEVRDFADRFLNFDHGRKVMVGIAANTPWQEKSRYENFG